MDSSIFDKMELVEYTDVKIGETYPIYGVITDILEYDESFDIKINDNVQATVQAPKDKIDYIKNKIFEAGIFVCKIHTIEDGIYYGDCSVIVFGKSSNIEQ